MTLSLTPIIEGDSQGETLVFVHGWPDTAAVWDEAVAGVRDRYRCVRATLPNFAGERSARWGYDSEAIVDALEIFVGAAGRGKPVTLVLHDWGCYWGYALHHRRPDLVSRLVGLDISAHYRPPDARAFVGFVAYQWWLLAAFGIGGPAGDWMTRGLAKIGKVPVDPAKLDAWMNYPYRNVWADLVTGRAKRLTRGYWPTCPILFVYGENKPFPFHSERWLAHVRKVGGDVVGLPCGHWVPHEPAFVDLLRRWLDEHGAKGVAA
ncbi:MAG: alpha/beta fold hydrolase [Polyangiaceae bacterium]